MRRSFGSGLIGLFGLAVVLGGAGFLFPASADAATKIAPTTTCSNGVDNSGGLGLICQVVVVNTITANGGTSRTTVRECHGAAGHPAAKCTTKVWIMNRPVTKVTQCNDSINGGGGTLRCSVNVTNNFVGISPHATAATVNECVGSGGGITTHCDPFPATTSGATITQCNGSANGGTLVRLECRASGTKSASRSVRINQCNGSANGGGSLVICSASIVNRVRSASSGGPTGPTSPPLPATNTEAVVQPAAPAAANRLALIGLVFVLAVGSIGAFLGRRGRGTTG